MLYRSIFTNPKLSAVKLFFIQACQQPDAKMAANSNLALILRHLLDERYETQERKKNKNSVAHKIIRKA